MLKLNEGDGLYGRLSSMSEIRERIRTVGKKMDGAHN
jgi:hypothetical protein